MFWLYFADDEQSDIAYSPMNKASYNHAKDTDCMQKPNILFVMADQMSAKALALYGTGQAKPLRWHNWRRGEHYLRTLIAMRLCAGHRANL